MLNGEVDPEDRRRAQRAIGAGADDHLASAPGELSEGRSRGPGCDARHRCGERSDVD
jgi:hypothetical protein